MVDMNQSLQSFPGITETARPGNYGSGFQEAVRGITGITNTALTLEQQQGEKKEILSSSLADAMEAEAKARDEQDYAIAAIRNENLKQESYLTSVDHREIDVKSLLSGDMEQALSALNQAERSGDISQSARIAIKRSILYKEMVMKNPGMAKELKNAFSIGSNSPGSGNLMTLQNQIDSIEEEERQDKRREKQEEASHARAQLREYGYATQGLDDENAIHTWYTSKEFAIQTTIARSKQLIDQQDVAKELRAFEVEKSLAATLKKYHIDLTNLYLQSVEAGTEGGSPDVAGASLPEQATLLTNQYIAEVTENFWEFPEEAQAFINGLTSMQGSIVTAVQNGQAIDRSRNTQNNQAIQNEILQYNLEQKKLNLNASKAQNIRDSLESQHQAYRNSSWITSAFTPGNEIYNEIGEAFRQQFGSENADGDWQMDSTTSNYLGLVLSSIDDANVAVAQATDPALATRIQNTTRLTALASALARDPNRENWMEDTTKLLMALTTGNQMNRERLSYSEKRALDKSLNQIALDPRLVAFVNKSPMVRQFQEPFFTATKNSVISYLQEFTNEVTEERVWMETVDRRFGAKETDPKNLWRKLGQFMQLDPVQTNSAGLPQFKLRTGSEFELAEGEEDSLTPVLNHYNRSIKIKGDKEDYAAILAFSGKNTLSDSLEYLFWTPQGRALRDFSQSRVFTERTPREMEDLIMEQVKTDAGNKEAQERMQDMSGGPSIFTSPDEQRRLNQERIKKESTGE